MINGVNRLPWRQLLSYLTVPSPSSPQRDQTCWPGRPTTACGGGCAPSRTWQGHVGVVDAFQWKEAEAGEQHDVNQTQTQTSLEIFLLSVDLSSHTLVMGEPEKKTRRGEIICCLHGNS